MISPKSASVNDLTNIMSGQDVKTFFCVFFSKQRHLGPVKMKNAKEEEKRSEKEKKSWLHDIKNESGATFSPKLSLTRTDIFIKRGFN